MTHDIDDLLQLIKMLEKRIIALEMLNDLSYQPDDSYYWNHG